jgi:beta-lactamase class D
MKTFVDKLEYGNRDIGGAPIAYFWQWKIMSIARRDWAAAGHSI